MNPEKKKIKNVLIFLKIFKSHGCENIHIVGSFVSNRQFPNDIDVCVDATNIDLDKLNREFPEFFNPAGLDKIKKEFNVHLIFYDNSLLEYF